MKQFACLFILLFIGCLSLSAQSFGCFDIEPNNNTSSIRQGIIYEPEDFFWESYIIKNGVSEGFYKEEYYNDYCTPVFVMEGNIINGKQVGIWKLYGETGYYTGEYINGRKNGLWKFFSHLYYPDTVQLAEVHFNNDSLNGSYKIFDNAGNVLENRNYKNGVPDCDQYFYTYDSIGHLFAIELKQYSEGTPNGLFMNRKALYPFDTISIEYYDYGKRYGRCKIKNCIIDYKNGKIDGKFIRTYSNGKMELELDYKNDKPLKIVHQYDTAGNPIYTSTLHNGNGQLNIYYSNGRLFSCFNYKNCAISGYFIRYSYDGSVIEEGMMYTDTTPKYFQMRHIEDIEDINLYSVWQQRYSSSNNCYVHSNGPEYCQTKYDDYVSDSIYICERYSNNRLAERTQFYQGLKYGKQQIYHNNGIIASEEFYSVIDKGTSKISVLDSIAKYYYENGTLKAELCFSKGDEAGTSYYYDESGNLVRTKQVLENGGSYNVFNGDTVNILDSFGRRQGKWIWVSGLYQNENPCSMLVTSIEYFCDNENCGQSVFYSWDNSYIYQIIQWIDSQNSYLTRFNSKGKIEAEGYIFHREYIEVGNWKFYNEKKGYLEMTGEFECGVQVGIWKKYNKHGKVIETIDYSSNGNLRY